MAIGKKMNSIEEQIEELEQKLVSLRASNLSAWNTYGSELCAGDMLRQEKIIEDQIKELKAQL